jgi:hypothetical protein
VNPLYQMLTGQGQQAPMQQQMPQAPMMSGMRFQNPLQKMNYIMQAMQNPAAFVKQHIPNLPDQIANDPNQILQYMQQNMGVTQQDIMNAQSQIPRF